jgi:hypothetical protein
VYWGSPHGAAVLAFWTLTSLAAWLAGKLPGGSAHEVTELTA